MYSGTDATGAVIAPPRGAPLSPDHDFSASLSASEPFFPEDAPALQDAPQSDASGTQFAAGMPADGYRALMRRQPLDAARERELFARYRGGDAQARQTLIEAHLWLATVIAGNYAGRGIEWSDLVGEGVLGLMRALDKFDLARGCRFSTCAAWWIREAIRRYCLETGRVVRLPAPVIQAVSACAKWTERTRAVTGRAPTLAELAQALGKPAGKVQTLLQCQDQATSLDTPAGPDTAETLIDRLPDAAGETPEQQLAKKETVACLESCLSKLPPRDQALLAQRFGLHLEEELSIAQLAVRWDLSGSRLRTIEARALARLRKLLRQHGGAGDLLPDC